MQDAPPPAGAATQLKLSAEVDRGPGASQRVSIVVEGQGPLAEQVAAEVGELFKRAVARALDATTAQPALPVLQPVLQTAVAQVAAPVAEPQPQPIREAPASVPSAAPPALAAVTAPIDVAAAVAPRPAPWFQRYRSRISLSLGIVLFALAVLVPLMVPQEMRREILPMPIALGLVGALSLFSGLMPEPDRSKKGDAKRQAVPAPTPAPAVLRPRSNVPVAQSKAPSAATRTFGAAFGAVFAIAGLVAPLALPNVTADERFVMMLGFAPIALIGAFLMWVFLRRPAAQTAASSATGNRGTRPQASGAAAITPGAMSKSTGALVALGVILGVVVLLVVLATVLPLLNAQP